MNLLIIDLTFGGITFETEQFLKKTAAGHTFTVYVLNKGSQPIPDSRIKVFKQETFDRDQIDADAIYVVNSSFAENIRFRIPYFYSIYAHTWKNEFDYEFFQKKYSSIKGATAVFVNDKKLSKYAHWLGLDSYFINKPVDINKYKFLERKFITPKLHIGYLPHNPIFSDSGFRDVLMLDMWVSAKANWVLHTPYISHLEDLQNVVCHEGVWDNHKVAPEFYKECHVIVNPENIYKKSNMELSQEYDSFDAMSTGCVSVHPNPHGNNTNIMFDKFHYFKLDFIDSNTLLETLRYIDKRRSKLYNMSKSSSGLIKKYYNVDLIVDEKLRIMERLT